MQECVLNPYKYYQYNTFQFIWKFFHMNEIFSYSWKKKYISISIWYTLNKSIHIVMDYIYCRIHILQVKNVLHSKQSYFFFLYCKIIYDKTEKYANNHKFESVQTKLHSLGKVNNTANSSEAFLIKLCHIFTYDRKK